MMCIQCMVALWLLISCLMISYINTWLYLGTVTHEKYMFKLQFYLFRHYVVMAKLLEFLNIEVHVNAFKGCSQLFSEIHNLSHEKHITMRTTFECLMCTFVFCVIGAD